MNRNSVIASIDWITVLLYLVLVFLGWLNIYSVTANHETGEFVNFSAKYFKQIIWIGFSLFLLTTILILDSKFFEAFSYVFYGASIATLLLVLVIGSEIKGARSWITFGSFSIQPAEFAKFATALAVSKLLTAHGFNLGKLKSTIIAFTCFMFPAMLIILQNDTGSAMVYFIFFLPLFREGLTGNYLLAALLAALYFIFSIIYSQMVVYLFVISLTVVYLFAQKEYMHLYVTTLILALLSGFWWIANRFQWIDFDYTYTLIIYAWLISGYYLVFSLVKRTMKYLSIPLFVILSFFYTLSTNYVFDNILGLHQQTRILVVLGLKDDPLGAEYNVTQSRIAIGAGGVTGKGFMKGTQTSGNFVPEQSTDFIFSTVGEEWGFLGSLFVISLFVILMLRLLFLAERQRSRFSRIYGYCVASIFFFHFAINIGMAIGLVPVIGIPLPFFSYGGSSLWSFTILLFIFIRLDASRKEILR